MIVAELLSHGLDADVGMGNEDVIVAGSFSTDGLSVWIPSEATSCQFLLALGLCGHSHVRITNCAAARDHKRTKYDLKLDCFMLVAKNAQKDARNRP